RLGAGLGGGFDVGAGEGEVLQRAGEPYRFTEAPGRLRGAPGGGPGGLGRVVEIPGHRRHEPTAAWPDGGGGAGGRGEGGEAVAVHQYERRHRLTALPGPPAASAVHTPPLAVIVTFTRGSGLRRSLPTPAPASSACRCAGRRGG